MILVGALLVIVRRNLRPLGRVVRAFRAVARHCLTHLGPNTFLNQELILRDHAIERAVSTNARKDSLLFSNLTPNLLHLTLTSLLLLARVLEVLL